MYKKILTLVKDSFFYGVINSIAQSISIFLLPIFTRIFSPEQYGIIDIISVSISVVSIMVLMNLNSAVARYFYDVKDDKEKCVLISTSFYAISITSLIFISLAWQKCEYVSYLLTKSKDYDGIIKIALLSIPPSILFEYLSLLIRMERNVKIFGIVNTTNILLTALLSIYLVVFLHYGIMGVFLAQLISKVIMLVVVIFFTYEYLTLKFSKQLLKKTLIYSLPAVPALFTNWAQDSIGRYFILTYLGSYSIGIFSVGFKVSRFINLIIQAFRMGWLPFSMSLIKEEDSREIYKKALTYYFIFFSVIGALFSIFSEEIIKILAGEQYYQGWKIVGLITGGFIIQGSSNIVIMGSLIAEKQYVTTISSFCGVVVNILFLQILVPKFGIEGASISFFIGTFIYTLICYLFSNKFFYINYEIKKIFWILTFYIFIIIFSIFVHFIHPATLKYFLKFLILSFFLFGLWITSVDKKEKILAKMFITNKFEILKRFFSTNIN